MKKLFALLVAIIIGIFSTTVSTADTVTVDCPTDTKIYEWARAYSKRCRGYKGKITPNNYGKDIRRFARRIALAPLSLLIGTACAEGRVMDGVTLLNDGNPIKLGEAEGSLFTVSPSTAKKSRGYYTDKKVPLTEYEKKLPGVVIGQNRGMIFSSSRPIAGDYIVPTMKDINLIVVDEVSRELHPTEDVNNKIFWKGNGKHVIKDVIADGQGQHWFCRADGKLATDLWLKIAKFGYGIKGMLQPGLATDIKAEVVDHWGVKRTITLGNTLLLNSSLVKGLGAYNSLEELKEHAEMWGLTNMTKQWQSKDHVVAKKRIMGTQPNSTNLELTKNEIAELLKPEALHIWAMKFAKVAWAKLANVKTARGRAIAARPNLIYKDLIMKQIDNQAGNAFLRNAQGKFMAEGQYLKMYMDKMVYSLVYVHGMNPNEAAKKAAEAGLHGEIRVSPYFADRKFLKDENGKTSIVYGKETHLDNKGRYIETALVRYPHGAPSETIIVKAYIDPTVPEDVIIFPAPVADKDGNVPVSNLYALRLQGADFDGDAVTAFTEKIWLEAQKRNIGKSYMIIPINTESTEKDKTLVTDETFEQFFAMKVDSLTNGVGLIATSLKYFISQFATSLRTECAPARDAKVIVDHACAMGDDIDEFKHGKATNDLNTFVVACEDRDVYLSSPYFNRYAKKYKDKADFDKAVFDKKGNEKEPGNGILDMYAETMEELMEKCKLPIKAEVSKASDGKDRFYFTVHPVGWKSKDVDLFTLEHGESQVHVSLPEQLEELYGIEHGTTFSAKELFQMLYRDHAATLKNLLGSIETEEDRDALVKVISQINERYTLATVAIVAWTKAMKKAKEPEAEELTAIEALKLFTTLMVQHTQKSRSTIDVMTRTGTVTLADGTTYERTTFNAERIYNYFLDVCGDGLLLLGTEKAEFAPVSFDTMDAAGVSDPDLEKAHELAVKHMKTVDRLVAMVPYGVDAVQDAIEAYDEVECAVDESEGWYSSNDDPDWNDYIPEDLLID